MARETRRHRRVSFPAIARLSWQDEHGNYKFTRGRCLDVSQSGLRVELPEPMALRSYVTVQAEVLGITENASVRHCARAGGKYIVGLEFSSPLKVSDRSASKVLLRVLESGEEVQ